MIAANLRPADIAEIKASSGRDPGEAIKASATLENTWVACLPDGEPAGIYGITETGIPGLGAIWMVATTKFHLLHRQFLREGRQEIERIGHGYSALYNFTDARNHVHHRWLKWAGFTFIKRHESYGAEGRPFYEFVRIMEKPDV